MLYLLLLGAVLGGSIYLFRPKWAGRWGRKARIVGYAYVAAVLLSALLQYYLGWSLRPAP
jgi:hypothetical protein